MSPQYLLTRSSDTGVAPSERFVGVHRIVDHRTWLAIDGVPVDKRIAADPSNPMHRLLHEEIINLVKVTREAAAGPALARSLVVYWTTYLQVRLHPLCRQYKL
jgi:hypothetical protein